ncbi:MAG: SUMF1/EgtB/PvdO family nonheme iron enzyme [Verrucomicrobia bacterium]|nr:SUMF1/EgtB/PvdO family nonheme iron enzyme [Verrucomicrobiota bacterium]
MPRWSFPLALVAAFAVGCGAPAPGDDPAGSDAEPTDAADATAEAGDGGFFVPIADLRVPCRVGGVDGVCIDVADCKGDRVPTPGFCPGPANIQCCTPRGETGPPPDGGPTDAGDAGGYCPTDPTASPNAGLTEEPGTGGCPAGMLRVAATPSFCIDRFEAAIEVLDGAAWKPWSPYYPPPAAGSIRAVSLRGAVPQGYVSGKEAQRACTGAKKRLCTNPEWLRACQGPGGTTYPYGATRVAGRCNDARTPHPAVSCFSTSASWIFSELGWPGINQQPKTVERTGTRTGCVTAEGAFDMMGNLHEWIWDDPTKYSSPVKAIDFRGGFYADTVVNGEGCLYRTSAHDFSHWDYSTGFRCCAD